MHTAACAASSSSLTMMMVGPHLRQCQCLQKWVTLEASGITLRLKHSVRTVGSEGVNTRVSE